MNGTFGIINKKSKLTQEEENFIENCTSEEFDKKYKLGKYKENDKNE